MTNGRFSSKKGWRTNIKTGGRLLRKGILGAAGAATLGTVGLAAGLASGDIGKGLKSGLVGMGAGYFWANALGNRAAQTVGKLGSEFKKGYDGAEDFTNRAIDREYYASEEWREASRKGVPKEYMQACRDKGVVDTKSITKLYEAGIDNPEVTQYAIRMANSMSHSDMRDANKVAHCISQCEAFDVTGQVWAAVQKLKGI